MSLATDALLIERQRAGNPVRVGILGPGFMGKALLHQITDRTPGMTVTAVYARSTERGLAALDWAGITDRVVADSSSQVDAAAARGAIAVTEDVDALTAADSVDVVVDATGAVEFGARAALSAIEHGKHLVLLNAELDATVGWELARRAASAGVVYTGVDGDQPGVQANLYRFVQRLGLTPLVCGNIKGLQDRFRNPTTQRGFAERWGQDPHMVTSFADGTKVNVEQALVANATGMSIHRRGMLGRDHAGHVDDLATMYDVDELRGLGGAVDYVVGTQPGPGIFVLGAEVDSRHQHYLELYKLGTGPLYSFYTPYHLCHFEVPQTIAAAALVGQATIRPAGPPQVEVITVAKTDLEAGTVLDALGGYHYYGEAERADVTERDQLLPVGLAEGCILRRDVSRESPVTYADVQLPAGRTVDELRSAQRSRS